VKGTRKENGVMKREDFLKASGGVLAGAGLLGVMGCDALSTKPAQQGGNDGGARGAKAKGKEAPQLAEMVENGELPPVEERLPDEPMVVEVTDRPGVYGGTWRNALLGTSNAGYIYCMIAYGGNMFAWKEQWTGATGTEEMKPNSVQSFEMNDDATEFTFQMRRGMKWSDGEPFTADDMVFTIEDVLMNKEISPVITSVLTTPDGDPASIEKLDDYSFRITFPGPSGLFMQYVAAPNGGMFVNRPKHYLQEFHKKYNPDVDKLAEEAGLDSWVDLFYQKAPYYGTNPDLPVLDPWKLVTPFGEGSQVIYERNPYYWKVDPDGSQLPYIDKVVFDIVEDGEVMLLKALNGDINLEAGPDTRFTSPANKPVLAENRQKGGYRFVDVGETRMNAMIISFNLAHKNETKREVFNNKDFRVGLSHAMNRKEIIDVTMQQQGVPYQVAPLPDSPFYDEGFATDYLEYDVELANEHLDKAFPEKNSEGIRLGPDGKPIVFTMEYYSAFRPEWTDMLELVRGYWREVGVEMKLKNVDRSLFAQRTEANEHDVTVWHGDGGLDVILQPKYYFPYDTQSHYGNVWAIWYSSRGAEGQEPPEAPKRQMELFDQIRTEPDPEEQTRLMKEILDIAREQFYSIGVVRETAKYFIASNEFGNLPENMLQGWTYPTPGPTNPEQYFIGG
jgi:peptide/nickel transport system substrate-binding protein